MTETFDTSLGELIAAVYEEYLAAFGDEDAASVATASMVNELLTGARIHEEEAQAA